MKHKLKKFWLNSNIFLCTISEIAISRSDQNIEIYKKSPSGYDLTATLSEHGQRVTGIDWDPKNNRIVTSGAVSLACHIYCL